MCLTSGVLLGWGGLGQGPWVSPGVAAPRLWRASRACSGPLDKAHPSSARQLSSLLGRPVGGRRFSGCPVVTPPAHLYFGAAQPQGDGSTGMSRQETVCSSLPLPQPGALALLTGPAPGYPGAGLRNSSRTPRPRGWSPVTVTRALWSKKSCTQIESLSLYKRGFV